MRDVYPEQIGSALRSLGEDLVAERRRVAQLERENKELRRELAALRRRAADQQAGRSQRVKDAIRSEGRGAAVGRPIKADAWRHP